MILVDNGGDFRYLERDEAMGLDHPEWEDGGLPFPFYRAYRRPIVVLRNDFKAAYVKRRLGDRDLPLGATLASEVEDYLADRFDLRVTLPPVKVRVSDGTIEDWRLGRGDFVYSWCNGCGEAHPAYPLETQEDVRRATRIESRHPAIPFLAERAIVTFRGGEFVGCFCRYEAAEWEGQDFAPPSEPLLEPEEREARDAERRSA